MDHRRPDKRVCVLLIVLVLAAAGLLNACGSSTETMPPATGTVLSASTPTAGLNACTGCHAEQTADWLTTRHANLDNSGDLYSVGSPTIGQVTGSCAKNCHDPNGDSNNLSPGYTGGFGINRPVVGCEACHGAGSLHADRGGVGPISLLSNTTNINIISIGTATVSNQFFMCTNCHQLLNSFGTGSNPNPEHLATAPTGSQYIITDTHFATPGDWSGVGTANVKAITGYAMDFSDVRVCVNCHNPHKPPTQNREWAQSAHGDKNPFNLNSTQTGYVSGAWAHYNWSTRPTCQRCHTTTGFSAYADALRSGNPTLAAAINNGTLTSSPVTSTASWKPEMLKCNGCHTDNKGTLRNPGQITANYDYVSGSKTYSKASFTYPDLAGSNVCMACHTGRESGDTVKGLNDPALLSAGTITTFAFTNMGFINSHYLTAGGQVFTVTGYEFGGRPYNNIPEYRHDKIGTPATREFAPYVDTGSNGPCIGCHMSRPNKNGNHLFLPISRSTTTIGLVTGIASEVCFNCHGPSSTLILDLVREQKVQFAEALEALKDQIAQKLNIYFYPYSPYWYRTPTYTDPKSSCNDNIPVRNWQTNGTEAAATGTYNPATNGGCTYAGNNDGISGTGKNNMGAAFNFNLLEHDPGAYVHNRIYTKRLIYDSIDWVDDGIMNYSVGATLDTECTGGTPPAWCAEAIMYLLPNGVLGIEAERP